jgi:hypothetical protein
MKKQLSLVLIAILALGVGIGYAAPMLIAPVNIQPYPHVPEGPKAPFSVDVVYADFNTAVGMHTEETNNPDGSLNHTETYPWTNVTYNVVLNVTNLSDQPAQLYDLTFAAGQNITSRQSILGGTIFDYGYTPADQYLASRHFGGVVDGVYLDGKYVNVTWMPNVYYDENDTTTEPYPECLLALTEAHMNYPWINNESCSFSGPLSIDQVKAFSADHTINGTIPDLPANASDTGVWFEGVPIAEYYNQNGNPLITEMYINGAWVDVTGKVTVNKTQPMTTVSNMLVDEVFTFDAQPYGNMNSTVGPVTTLPTWGDWGAGKTYFWTPIEYASAGFNTNFAPHESRLIAFNHTQPFITTTPQDAPSNGIAALKTGNLELYASASNYICNQPVNGTFCNTVSIATEIKDIHFEPTSNGYTYNNILAANQFFQPSTSAFEVKIATRTEP